MRVQGRERRAGEAERDLPKHSLARGLPGYSARHSRRDISVSVYPWRSVLVAAALTKYSLVCRTLVGGRVYLALVLCPFLGPVRADRSLSPKRSPKRSESGTGGWRRPDTSATTPHLRCNGCSPLRVWDLRPRLPVRNPSSVVMSMPCRRRRNASAIFWQGGGPTRPDPGCEER
jgi:hypothetical protein